MAENDNKTTIILVLTSYLLFETEKIQGVILLSWNRNYARVSPTYIYFPLVKHNFHVGPITQSTYFLSVVFH